MAITIKEIHDGRDGEGNIDGEKLRTRVFRAITDDNATDTTAIEAELAGGAYSVTYGDAHPIEAACLCQRIRIDNVSHSKKVWLITCSYSNKAIANPLTEAAKFNWTTEKKTAPLVRDYNAEWICNSAGMPYDPPPEYDDEIDIVRVRKNLAAMPAWWPGGFRRTMNSDIITIDGRSCAVKTVRMIDRTLSEVKEKSGISYREIELTLAIDPATWDLVLFDSGFAEINAADPTGDRIKITIGGGTEPTQPVPLNGSGYKLSNPSPTNFFVRTHVVYAPVAYSGLPLT